MDDLKQTTVDFLSRALVELSLDQLNNPNARAAAYIRAGVAMIDPLFDEAARAMEINRRVDRIIAASRDERISIPGDAPEPIPMVTPGLVAAVTFDDWFYAPDGQTYRVAFGPVTIIPAKTLFGFQPKGDTNWYAQVGFGPGAVMLAGCRIHSAIIGDRQPLGVHVYIAPTGDQK